MVKLKNQFSKLVTRLFPNIPFDKAHGPDKFIGLIQVKGQRPIALFVNSYQAPYYDEVVL